MAEAEVIEIVPDETLAQQAVVVSAVISVLMDKKKALAVELGERWANGTTRTAFHPQSELTLGTINKSNPDPSAHIIDKAAFEDWVREVFAGDLVDETAFGPSEEIAAVLHEHAPHLLKSVTTIPEWVRAKALSLAAQHDVPGTERTPGTGVVSVRPGKHAKQLVAELLTHSPVPLELESGQ